jgi:flagellar basal body-associated protein FliL
MAEFSQLAAEYAKLGSKFEEQIRQYNVKQLVSVHEQKIKDANSKFYVGDRKARTHELEELLKEVKKLVSLHEDRIKAGTVNDELVAEMKAHFKKLHEQSEKLANELGQGTGTPAKVENAVSGTPSKTPGPNTGGTGGTSSGAQTPPAGSSGVVKIVLLVVVLVVAAVGVAYIMQPELFFPPPVTTPTWTKPVTKAPPEPEKKPWFEDKKAQEERLRREAEESSSGVIMVVAGTLGLGLVIGVVMMMKHSSASAGDPKDAELTEEEREAKYGRFVKKADDDGAEVIRSHRLDSKKQS